MQEKIKQHEEFLKKDYGTANEYYKLSEKCFDITLKQYVYEICPYNEAKQKEGSSSTSLGRWTGFGKHKDGSPTMLFTGGQTCWQGPQRSITVIMKCNSENKVMSVEEPNKCVYEMVFGTPAVCDISHIQALKLNLAAALEGIDHDEL
jgi:protein kinase C substrate 80K-H